MEEGSVVLYSDGARAMRACRSLSRLGGGRTRCKEPAQLWMLIDREAFTGTWVHLINGMLVGTEDSALEAFGGTRGSGIWKAGDKCPTQKI